MVKKLSVLFIFGLLFWTSCKESKQTETKIEVPQTKYTLTPFENSAEYPNASLSQMKYTDGKFSFDVANYDLGNQTPDAESKMCANSAKGQHIHLIVDKDPYAAKYTNEFEHAVDDDKNYILAFLSRSYHESIKTDQAHIAQKVKIKDKSLISQENIEGAMLFYSRPKGTYIGKQNTNKVMLDFYLVNTEISEGGNYVEANINGELHKITKWQPYYIEGLPMGDNYIGLVLRDKDGNQMDIPLNPVKRVFTLKEDPTPEG